MRRLLLILCTFLAPWAAHAAASPDGTAVYVVGASLVDPAGNVWAIINTPCNMPAGHAPCAAKNGVAAGTNYDVAELLLCKGNVYHKNKSGQWYEYSASAVVGLAGWPYVAAGPPSCPLAVSGSSSSSGGSGSSSSSSSSGGSTASLVNNYIVNFYCAAGSPPPNLTTLNTVNADGSTSYAITVNYEKCNPSTAGFIPGVPP